jgi:uncharacterized protein (DUF427 family)
MKMQAIWNGKVIAESDSTIVVEGNHYFPADAIRKEFFKQSERISNCFWKGSASYYDIQVGKDRNPAAAWYYPEPGPAAAMIKDHVAFWRGIQVIPSSNE